MWKKAVFFDWTGTLADERELDKAVCDSMERLISERKKVPIYHARKQYRDFLNGIVGTWKWYTYPFHSKIFDIDWKKAQMTNLFKLKIIPYAKELLEYLRNKGYCICLLTNAAQEVVSLRVEYLEMSDLFDLIIGSDQVQALKSEGKHFQVAIKMLQINPLASYSIGDNFIEDIEPAKKLNVKTVFCKFGSFRRYYHTNPDYFENQHQQIKQTDFIINDLMELKRII